MARICLVFLLIFCCFKCIRSSKSNSKKFLHLVHKNEFLIRDTCNNGNFRHAEKAGEDVEIPGKDVEKDLDELGGTAEKQSTLKYNVHKKKIRGKLLYEDNGSLLNNTNFKNDLVNQSQIGNRSTSECQPISKHRKNTCRRKTLYRILKIRKNKQCSLDKNYKHLASYPDGSISIKDGEEKLSQKDGKFGVHKSPEQQKSTTSSPHPPTEKPDAKDSDLLETYSQFAERVIAEKKTSGTSGSGNGHGNNGVSPPKEQKVKSKNYASTDCGAKFLAANPEASHSSKIVNSNKDEYMLNQCTEKIWAVIELCENIRPQRFEIANFELFSNSPKDILLYGGHRYPTRDWTLLGTYVGEEGNRDIQAFPVSVEAEFYKYVKLEIHSFYGTEFFCPLSMFRIFGLSEFEVIEDNEYSEEQLDTEEDKASPSHTGSEEKKRGGYVLPDVIRSVLRGVYSVIKRNSHSKDGSSDNGQGFNGYSQNCRSLSTSFAVGQEYCSFSESLNYILSCYFDEYQQLMKSAPPFHSINKEFCDGLAQAICSSFNNSDTFVYDTVCNNSYICVMLSPKHVLAMCHMQDSFLIKKAMGYNFGNDTQVLMGNGSSNASISKDTFEDSSSLLNNVTKPNSSVRNVDVPLDLSQPSTKPVRLPEMVNNRNKTANTTSTKATAPENTPKVPKPKELPTKTDKTKDEVSPSPSSQKKKDTSQQPDKKSSNNEDSNTHPPSGSGPPEGKTGSSNKESVVVRLSNRVKALEHNISISSQYLEELSRRYKSQMEEMQKQFNITIQALNQTTHEAYERDLQHQKRLKLVEERMQEILDTAVALKQERDELISRVVEQHLIFLFIHVVFLGSLLWWCFRKRNAEIRRLQHEQTEPLDAGVLNRRIPNGRVPVDVSSAESVNGEACQKVSSSNIKQEKEKATRVRLLTHPLRKSASTDSFHRSKAEELINKNKKRKNRRSFRCNTNKNASNVPPINNKHDAHRFNTDLGMFRTGGQHLQDVVPDENDSPVGDIESSVIQSDLNRRKITVDKEFVLETFVNLADYDLMDDNPTGTTVPKNYTNMNGIHVSCDPCPLPDRLSLPYNPINLQKNHFSSDLRLQSNGNVVYKRDSIQYLKPNENPMVSSTSSSSSDQSDCRSLPCMKKNQENKSRESHCLPKYNFNSLDSCHNKNWESKPKNKILTNQEIARTNGPLNSFDSFNQVLEKDKESKFKSIPTKKENHSHCSLARNISPLSINNFNTKSLNLESLDSLDRLLENENRPKENPWQFQRFKKKKKKNDSAPHKKDKFSR